MEAPLSNGVVGATTEVTTGSTFFAATDAVPLVDVRPPLSLMVKNTEYVPGTVYVCVPATVPAPSFKVPADVELSPQVQSTVWPVISYTSVKVPLAVIGVPTFNGEVTEMVPADGATFLIWIWDAGLVPAFPPLSVTVRVTE
jgi:hypothetical protein